MYRTYRIYLFVLMLVLFGLAVGTGIAQDNMAETTRENIIRIIEEGFNQGNLSVVDELFAPDFVAHNANGSTETGPEAFKANITNFRAAIPDLQANADPIIVDGDWAAFRFTLDGTFTNELESPDQEPIPPTGNPISLSANVVIRLNEDGQVAEEWDIFDNMNFLTQLGVIPAPEGAEAMTLELPSIPADSITSGMEQAHEEVMMRMVEEYLNAGDVTVGTELFAEDFLHVAPDGVRNRDEDAQAIQGYRAALPDFHVEPVATLYEGDWAAALFDFTSTFTGELSMPDGSTVPGNGNAVQMPIAVLFHFNEEGQIDLIWEQFDYLTFLTQLGMIVSES